jgi:hypothetical protein
MDSYVLSAFRHPITDPVYRQKGTRVCKGSRKGKNLFVGQRL